MGIIKIKVEINQKDNTKINETISCFFKRLYMIDKLDSQRIKERKLIEWIRKDKKNAIIETNHRNIKNHKGLV